MTTWTATTKAAAPSWTPSTKASAPSWSPVGKSDPDYVQYELNIGDGYRLLIATDYYITVQPASSGTTWSYTPKS